MDKANFRLLATYAKVAARSIGMQPRTVVASNGKVSLEGTGIQISWTADALGSGQDGWLVSETFHNLDMLTGNARFETRKIVAIEPKDIYGAARAAALAAAERNLDVALGQAIAG